MKRSNTGPILCLLVLGAILLILHFRHEYLTLDPYDPRPVWVRETWWGFKTEDVYLRWMKAPGYDNEAWCAKSKRGNWYPFIIEYEEP